MTRIYIANALPEDVARIGQELDLSGTVHAALGFGVWGIEPTTVIVSEWDSTDIDRFLFLLFLSFPDEEAVYITNSQAPGYLVYRTDILLTPTS